MIVVPAQTDAGESGGRLRACGEFDLLREGGYSGAYAKRWFDVYTLSRNVVAAVLTQAVTLLDAAPGVCCYTERGYSK